MRIHEFIRHVCYYFRLLQNSIVYRKVKYYIVNAKPHFSLSILLHVVIAVILLINLSSVAFDKFSNNTEKAILIDLVPISNITNVKIASETGKKSYSKDTEVAKPQQTKQKVLSDNGEKVAINKNIRSIKKKPPESEVVKNKGNPNKLQTALKAVKQAAKEIHINVDTQKEQGVVGKGKAPYNQLKPQSISVAESIRSQFIHCWSVPHGALNVENLRVKVSIDLDSSGKVLNADIVDTKRYNNNPFFRAMADGALRAVYKCSPLQGLPEERYSLWKNMELVFDPKDMLR